jgi:hypothetical protein
LFSWALAVPSWRILVGAMSDLKGRLITICMLVGALAMIGLVLTGTLQMSRLPVAQVATK